MCTPLTWMSMSQRRRLNLFFFSEFPSQMSTAFTRHVESKLSPSNSYSIHFEKIFIYKNANYPFIQTGGEYSHFEPLQCFTDSAISQPHRFVHLNDFGYTTAVPKGRIHPVIGGAQLLECGLLQHWLVLLNAVRSRQTVAAMSHRSPIPGLFHWGDPSMTPLVAVHVFISYQLQY